MEPVDGGFSDNYAASVFEFGDWALLADGILILNIVLSWARLVLGVILK